MKMKQKRRKKSEPTPLQSVTYMVARRLQEGGVILLFSLAAFLLVALISHHGADPGWSRTAFEDSVRNVAGPAGAWISDLCLYLFGYLAFGFPLLIGFGCYRMFKGRLKEHQASTPLWLLRILGFILAVAGGSGLAALHFSHKTDYLPDGAGGILGRLLADTLTQRLSYLGSTLLLLSLFLSGVTLATGLSWLQLMDALGRVSWELICLFPAKLIEIFKARSRASQTEIKPKHETLRASALQALENRRTGEEPVSASARPKPVMHLPEPYLKVHKNSSTQDTLPRVELLEAAGSPSTTQHSQIQLESLSRTLEHKLMDFGIAVRVVAVYPGPVITRFEMELAAGLKVSKITSLAKDLARALSVSRVRVVEVIPGKSYVGLEIPNPERETVRLREILESQQYANASSALTLGLGKDIAGHPYVVDLAKMPHLLVAGTTGSGKSVGVNAMLLSMLYKATPQDLRLILIDPKMLELSIYEGIPHLLTPVVTDMKEAASALKWCVAEMERRYQLMAALGVRNILGYNQKIIDGIKLGMPIQSPIAAKPGEEKPLLEQLPYIVVIIDEFADMMMIVGKKVEELIPRIAQKARAAGIHMILATQRPSVDVITGLIKANIPTRIAFQVSSRIDSRTILDQQGAEQLLGHGDMLYLPPGSGIPIRVHGAFVSDQEVHDVVEELKNLGAPRYVEEILQEFDASLFKDDANDTESDPLYDDAVQIVAETRKASISLLQRRLKVGYNRAARLIEHMELVGAVGPMQSNGAREVWLSPIDQ